MKRIINYQINLEDQGQSINAFLKKQGYAGHLIRMLKNIPGSVLLDGSPALNISLLRAGQILTITVEDQVSSPVIPVKMNLDIVFEDEDILIINKEPGLSVPPSSKGFESSLANGVCHYFFNQGLDFVFRPAHRLDRYTSGLLIIAKNIISSGRLFFQIKNKEVKRRYLAIVQGETPLAGEITAPIARAGEGIKRQVDWEQGLYAKTFYKRLAYTQGRSLLWLELATGRTHQIRVHLNHLGFPICGDSLYGSPSEQISRQALHSASLEFRHPLKKTPLSFTCPMPEDMRRLLKNLP